MCDALEAAADGAFDSEDVWLPPLAFSLFLVLRIRAIGIASVADESGGGEEGGTAALFPTGICCTSSLALKEDSDLLVTGAFVLRWSRFSASLPSLDSIDGERRSRNVSTCTVGDVGGDSRRPVPLMDGALSIGKSLNVAIAGDGIGEAFAP